MKKAYLITWSATSLLGERSKTARFSSKDLECVESGSDKDGGCKASVNDCPTHEKPKVDHLLP